MDKELSSDFDARLYNTDLEFFVGEPAVINRGGIIHTLSGHLALTVNFKRWEMPPDSAIVLFPGDVVQAEKGPDFQAEVFSYDGAMLREASVKMEYTVYSLLRGDRCRGDQPIVSAIVRNLFGFLRVFFSLPGCSCVDEVALLQLKAFFVGFCDFLRRNPQDRPPEEGSRRVNELFAEFMELVSKHYKEYRDVSFYANRMHVSTKYLSQIVNKKTHHNPKTIIDHYVIMQLKLCLRTSRDSIKQIGWQYHFNDDSFFCRYFKSHTGVTPQEYRKSKVPSHNP